MLNTLALPNRVIRAATFEGMTPNGVPGGLTENDAVEVASMLDQGGIDALIPIGGTSSMNPMLLFRGESLLKG